MKIVYDMADKPSPHPQEEYHAAEYLDEMETLLLHQVLTAFPDEEARRTFLIETGLGYLTGKMIALNEAWRDC